MAPTRPDLSNPEGGVEFRTNGGGAFGRGLLAAALAATTPLAAAETCSSARKPERENGPATADPTLCKQGVRGSSPLGSTPGQRPFPFRTRASFVEVQQQSAAVTVMSGRLRGHFRAAAAPGGCSPRTPASRCPWSPRSGCVAGWPSRLEGGRSWRPADWRRSCESSEPG